MTDSCIAIDQFKKVYGKFTAVNGISLEVKQGEIYGLLGPNGAGKTSTLECLEGLRQPDGGTLRVMGINPAKEAGKLRRVIGVQLQASGLPANITVREAMDLFSAYHGTASRYDLLERLGLGDNLGKQYGTMSTGQQRRLALALAVAHNPAIVILDEPTAGLDVGTRVELHRLMHELKARGTTILLATHDMAEAEKMADRVSILLNGRIAATGTPKEITATGSGLTKISVQTSVAALIHDERWFPGTTQRTVKDDYVIYFSRDPGQDVAAIVACLNAQADTLIDLRVERPSLEDRFLEITGNGDAI